MKKYKNAFWRLLYRLHRYIGLVSAIVLIIISITGIALNHTEDLMLDSQMIASDAILDWYGIESPSHLKTYATENHWLTQINQQIYFDHSMLLKNEQELLGVVETAEFIVAALSDSLLLISLQGELIEQSSMSGVELIGVDQQQHIVVKSASGIVYSDDGLLSWYPYINEMLLWSKAKMLPDEDELTIKNSFRSSILPMERVILDLHSGRFFGNVGVIIVDISGVLLILLALSGCAIWLKHKLRVFKRR